MNDKKLDSAIVAKDLYKTFKLPHEQHAGVKQAVINIFQRNRGYEAQKVLNNVSFDIKKGSFFGIVGRNGSGKSTLLKLLAGIYVPDKGEVTVNGSLTPFIELGVGFNPELSGRENVFLNGALLGFSKDEVSDMYEEIVEFAELEKFMDQKLKNYSSGMQVRLAFSIAIRARSDVLLIDEVLAVGDSAFQKKCFDYFVQLKKNKKTVVLVTHDMGAVEKFCDQALVINKGKVVGLYKPHEAAVVYDELNAEDDASEASSKERKTRWGSGLVKAQNIRINNQKNHAVLKQFDDLSIKINLEGAYEKVVVGLAFYDQFGVNLSGPNSEKVSIKAPGAISYKVKKLAFNPGDYTVTVAVFNEDSTKEYDHMPEAISFRVKSEDHQLHGKINLAGQWDNTEIIK